MKMCHTIFSLIICSLLFLFCEDNTPIVETQGREYKIHVPQSYTGANKVPLVLVLHGYHFDVSGMPEYSEFSKKADTEGFIVAYPIGTREDFGNRNYVWNAGIHFEQGSRNADDVGFLSGLIDTLLGAYMIDETKVFVAGHSNGAMMTYKLSANIPEKITAMACIAGPMYSPIPTPNSSVALMHIHGAKDHVVPYEGGLLAGRMPCPPQDSILKIWQQWNKCSTTCDTILKDTLHHEVRWKSTEGTGDIVLCYLYNAGHDWPSIDRTNWSATDRIWNFFEKF